MTVPADDLIDHEERRRLESRMSRLETAITALDKRLAHAEWNIEKIINTIDSRYEALERGQAAILGQLKEIVPAFTLYEWKKQIDTLDTRVTLHAGVINQITGMGNMTRILGIGGIIGGALAFIKYLLAR